jgi:hypothetical protein
VSSDIPTSTKKVEHDLGQDHELDYVLDKERKLQRDRSYYDFSSSEQLIKNLSSIKNTPIASPARFDKSPSLNIEKFDDVEELLPPLDLMGLFDEQPIEVEKREKKSEQQVIEDDEGNLLPALDLYDLLDEVLDEFEEEESALGEDADIEQSGLLLEPEACSLIDDEYASAEFFTEKRLGPPGVEDEWFDLLSEYDDEEYDVSWADNLDVEFEGTLSRDERAWQVAMPLAEEYALDPFETRVLAEIFIRYGWSACRVAMDRELSSGTTLDELVLAADVKDMWDEYPEFFNEFETSYRTMSWPLALSIIRSFEGYPAVEEVELLLLRLYEHWRTDKISKLIFRSFGEFLYDKFGYRESNSDLVCEWKIEGAKYIEYGFFHPPRVQDIPAIINSSRSDQWLENVRRYNPY